MLQIKRVYEKAQKEDGTRVLVDRLWPRGLTKQKAKVDIWLKDIAPSAALRVWFKHDPKKWGEFSKRYAAELRAHKEAVGQIAALSKKGRVTLLYGARDTEHNEAVVLKDFLQKKK